MAKHSSRVPNGILGTQIVKVGTLLTFFVEIARQIRIHLGSAPTEKAASSEHAETALVVGRSSLPDHLQLSTTRYNPTTRRILVDQDGRISLKYLKDISFPYTNDFEEDSNLENELRFAKRTLEKLKEAYARVEASRLRFNRAVEGHKETQISSLEIIRSTKEILLKYDK